MSIGRPPTLPGFEPSSARAIGGCRRPTGARCPCPGEC